jgi:alkanesulfonate monooxygenase SsuD/methylene tetrahydromethanopterin reductase-like flavin-dependent oxidoreductase (luciferase family)
MKIGVSVPNIGPVATPEAVKTIAQKAEALGYNSLWTVERVLWPVQPKAPYPVSRMGRFLNSTNTVSVPWIR